MPIGAGLCLTALGTLYEPRRYPDVKDPSQVFDGTCWHIFGTGCGLAHGLDIAHATASRLEGPWTELPPARLLGVDQIVFPSAPGVCAEGTDLHMFLQHDFNVLGGHLEHLISRDGGLSFASRDTAVRSVAGTGEAGIYDPDPAEVGGERFLTYAGMSVIGQPDLFLARSRTGSWDGPWERLGRILDHQAVEGHNQVGDPDYEWGLEGPQLVELPWGGCLLTAACFLSGRPRGCRQRLLLALADQPIGPYRVLGSPLEPEGGSTGENGHGTAAVLGDRVHLVYQERAADGSPWRFKHALITREGAPA